MGQKIPTKVSFLRAVRICFLAVFWPKRLEELEEEEAPKLDAAPADEETRIRKVHHAFWTSFILILGFGAIGISAGLLLKCYYGSPSTFAINVLQIIGAGLLLWGTLFVRGFEIQSFASVTLGERVDKWLYRTMYCIGTAVIICSLAWA